MKNASRIGKQALATFFLLFGLLAFGFSAPSTIPDCNCTAPTVTITAQASNSVSFSWGAVSGATAYRVWYVRANDNYTSSETTLGSTSISFSSLPQGIYNFYFVTDCGEESSAIIITDDLIMH
ncbi:MAG: hypothetical protein GC192_21470 [Bacteroidetes bacterium]|nr:hypothetical protein [Bacteroidota bacterium]